MLVIAFLAALLFLILGYFFMSFICLVIVIVLFPVWYRFLGEELTIFFLKKHDGYCTYDELVEEYSEKTVTRRISRLKKQSIVDIEDGVVMLVDRNYVCAFDRELKNPRKQP